MDRPHNTPAAPPQDEREAIWRLRAQLRSVTDFLDGLLVDGFPLRGRSAHDREAYAQWAEDRYSAVSRAREALSQTAPFD